MGERASRISCLIPSAELLEENLSSRGDDERVKKICRQQREVLVAACGGGIQENEGLRFAYYTSHAELECFALAFAQQLGCPAAAQERG